MHGFLTDIDSFLIGFYRLTGMPCSIIYLGTTVLAFLAVMVGELTMSVAYLVNRSQIEEGNDELVKMNNLSITALKRGSKEGYTACNKMANELFGRQFFLMLRFVGFVPVARLLCAGLDAHAVCGRDLYAAGNAAAVRRRR